jgi:hypothetical protein
MKIAAMWIIGELSSVTEDLIDQIVEATTSPAMRNGSDTISVACREAVASSTLNGHQMRPPSMARTPPTTP